MERSFELCQQYMRLWLVRQRLLRIDYRFSTCGYLYKVRAISWVGTAPSRRIIQDLPPPLRSTIVVACVRAVGPPSTISGICPPSCSRTHIAEVHSGSPARLA